MFQHDWGAFAVIMLLLKNNNLKINLFYRFLYITCFKFILFQLVFVSDTCVALLCATVILCLVSGFLSESEVCMDAPIHHPAPGLQWLCSFSKAPFGFGWLEARQMQPNAARNETVEYLFIWHDVLIARGVISFEGAAQCL